MPNRGMSLSHLLLSWILVPIRRVVTIRGVWSQSPFHKEALLFQVGVCSPKSIGCTASNFMKHHRLIAFLLYTDAKSTRRLSASFVAPDILVAVTPLLFAGLGSCCFRVRTTNASFGVIPLSRSKPTFPG